MPRIILGLLLITGTLGAVAIGSTSAFFSDTETSRGNIFTAGDIDLQIDNESYYNGVFNQDTSWEMANLSVQKFFNFLDLKPGDFGEDTISIHVNTNDAYMCADVSLTSNNDNGINEPEAADGDATDGTGNGELAGLVNFAWWADDGDNVFEDDETLLSPIGPIGALPLGATTTLTLADSSVNIWSAVPGPITGGVTKYIGKAWCFGTLAAAPLAQDFATSTRSPANTTGGFTCNGSAIDNKSQTDSLTADISFRAVQARNNPGFRCVPPPTFGACTDPTLSYADRVVSYSQGTRKNGSAVLAARSNPTSTLGIPQTTGTFYDNPAPADSTFFSLGFKLGTTTGGNIVVEFTNNVIVDGVGNDIKVWEVTGGTSYPDEFVRIEASQNGTTWFTVASSTPRDAQADLAVSGLAWAKYLRITDVSPLAPFEATADGFDVDAIQALNCGVPALLLDNQID